MSKIKPLAYFQLGKKGLTENFIINIANALKKRESVKVHVLKSATRNKKEIEEMEKRICSELKNILGKNFSSRRVGFTFIIKRSKKVFDV